MPLEASRGVAASVSKSIIPEVHGHFSVSAMTHSLKEWWVLKKYYN